MNGKGSRQGYRKDFDRPGSIMKIKLVQHANILYDSSPI